MNEKEQILTGYPSIDKPWLKYYSEEAINAEFPACTVYQNIYEHNKEHLEDIALVYFGTRMTYGKMFEEIEKTVTAFVNYGVKKEDKVILFTSSTPEIVIAVLALNKIGAVANMINPLFEEEQIIARINETEATLMIAMEQLWPQIENIVDKLCIKKYAIVSVTDAMPFLKKRIVRLKTKVNISYSEKIVTWKTFIEQYSKHCKNLISTYERDLPFVMVYSSGTTGASKGIVLTNDGINATIANYIFPDFPYEREDRFLQMVPVWFSTGLVISCLMPLCLGITVVLEPVFNEQTFCHDLWKYKPAMTLVATSLWLAMIKDRKLQKTDMSFLKYPITGGEQLLPRVESILNHFLTERNCQSVILQGWGMCELGGTVCTNNMKHNKSGSVGLPIKGVVVAAFDRKSNEERKYNQRGELRVMSPARMKHYYKNEEATNNYFYTDYKGRTWGCTGDIGYVDEDGDVFVLGRVEDVFTSQEGRKVYNFDIESVIYQSGNVAQCEVVGLKTEQGFDVPVAHIIKESGYAGTDTELVQEMQELCREGLESDSIPRGYKICTVFPVKASGKRDMEKIQQDRNGFVRVENGELEKVNMK